MALFAISDLHLSSSTNKSMDVFGGNWENYTKKIWYNWQKTVAKNDGVIIVGDISWATYLNNAFKDLEFINNLNGKKFILKGNHDYFWTTLSKLERYKNEMSLNTLNFLHNTAVLYEGVAICGCRGWAIPCGDSSAEDVKIFKREKQRLMFSISSAKRLRAREIVVAIHYPPIEFNKRNTEMFDLISEAGIKICVYGHLHGKAHEKAIIGKNKGVNLKLVSCDYVDFMPQLLEI